LNNIFYKSKLDISLIQARHDKAMFQIWQILYKQFPECENISIKYEQGDMIFVEVDKEKSEDIIAEDIINFLKNL